MAPRPTTAPIQNPVTDGFLPRRTSKNIHEHPAAVRPPPGVQPVFSAAADACRRGSQDRSARRARRRRPDGGAGRCPARPRPGSCGCNIDREIRRRS